MDRRQATYFLCKKWTLFTFCIIGIISTFVTSVLLTLILIRGADEIYSDLYSSARNIVKVTGGGGVWFLTILAILIQCLGMFGSHQIDYHSTLYYTIFMTLLALASLRFVAPNNIGVNMYWYPATNFAIVFIACLFLYDLRKINRDESSRQLETEP